MTLLDWLFVGACVAAGAVCYVCAVLWWASLDDSGSDW